MHRFKTTFFLTVCFGLQIQLAFSAEDDEKEKKDKKKAAAEQDKNKEQKTDDCSNCIRKKDNAVIVIDPKQIDEYEEALKKFKSTEYYREALVNKESDNSEIIKEGDPYNDFLDTDKVWEYITAHPEQKQKYKLTGMTNSDIKNICKAYDVAAKDLDVKDVKNQAINKHVSNCATASFLAIIKMVRLKYGNNPTLKNIVEESFSCPPIWPKAYSTYAGLDGFKRFMLGYSDSKGKVRYEGFLKNLGITGKAEDHYKRIKIPTADLSFPKKFDPLLINRKDKSGHSVIFHSFIDKDGENIEKSNLPAKKLCYWSSNGKFKGASNRCEDLSKISFVDIIKL